VEVGQLQYPPQPMDDWQHKQPMPILLRQPPPPPDKPRKGTFRLNELLATIEQLNELRRAETCRRDSWETPVSTRSDSQPPMWASPRGSSAAPGSRRDHVQRVVGSPHLSWPAASPLWRVHPTPPPGKARFKSAVRIQARARGLLTRRRKLAAAVGGGDGGGGAATAAAAAVAAAAAAAAIVCGTSIVSSRTSSADSGNSSGSSGWVLVECAAPCAGTYAGPGVPAHVRGDRGHAHAAEGVPRASPISCTVAASASTGCWWRTQCRAAVRAGPSLGTPLLEVLPQGVLVYTDAQELPGGAGAGGYSGFSVRRRVQCHPRAPEDCQAVVGGWISEKSHDGRVILAREAQPEMTKVPMRAVPQLELLQSEMVETHQETQQQRTETELPLQSPPEPEPEPEPEPQPGPQLGPRPEPLLKYIQPGSSIQHRGLGPGGGRVVEVQVTVGGRQMTAELEVMGSPVLDERASVVQKTVANPPPATAPVSSATEEQLGAVMLLRPRRAPRFSRGVSPRDQLSPSRVSGE
jgi:hypothetical protein